MAYMDCPRETIGLGPVFKPTRDAEADMARIKGWFGQFNGRNWRQITTE